MGLPSGSCSRQGLSADLAGGPDRMLPYSAIGPGARLCSEYAATMAAATKSPGEPKPDVAFFSDWPRMEPSRNQSNNSSREFDVPAFQLTTSVLQRADALRNLPPLPCGKGWGVILFGAFGRARFTAVVATMTATTL